MALKRQIRWFKLGDCLSPKEGSSALTFLPLHSGNPPWARRGCGAFVSHGRVLGGEGGEESCRAPVGEKVQKLPSEKQRSRVLWAGTHSVKSEQALTACWRCSCPHRPLRER